MIQVQSIDEIPQATYDEALVLTEQVIREAFPDVDTRRGVVGDTTVVLHAVLGAARRLEGDRMIRSESLAAIERGAAVDPQVAADLFSNYRVAPRTGQPARGTVTIALSQAYPAVIPNGYILDASGGRRFRASSAFAAKLTEADLRLPTDRLLTSQQDGTYTFAIEVIADVVGEAGMLRTGTALTPARPLQHFARAVAASDFTGGRNSESLAETLGRLELGVSGRGWSHVKNIEAIILNEPEFEALQLSVIRAGAGEMLRDKHSVFAIALGNRLDIWFKPKTEASVTTVTADALYLGGTAWRITLDRDVVPGAYEVTTLLRDGRTPSAAVSPTSVTRGASVAEGGPDVANSVEAAFSRFQTLTIEFDDPLNSGETPTANTSTASYAVTVRIVDQVVELQDFVLADDVGPIAGDAVVHAAIPCFVSVDLEVGASGDDPDVAAIASAVASLVNTTPFNSAVYSAAVATTVSPLLPLGAVLRRVRLTGLLLRPDGEQILLRDNEVLAAPTHYSTMTSPRTVGFYCTPNDVTTTVITV